MEVSQRDSKENIHYRFVITSSKTSSSNKVKDIADQSPRDISIEKPVFVKWHSHHDVSDMSTILDIVQNLQYHMYILHSTLLLFYCDIISLIFMTKIQQP